MLGEECDQTKNVLHASDCQESAIKEIAIFKKILNRKEKKK